MKKRIISAALVVVLILSLFCGCTKTAKLTERDKERITIIEGRNQRKIEEEDYSYALEVINKVDKWVDDICEFTADIQKFNELKEEIQPILDISVELRSLEHKEKLLNNVKAMNDMNFYVIELDSDGNIYPEHIGILGTKMGPHMLDLFKYAAETTLLEKQLETIGTETIINYDDLWNRVEEAFEIAQKPLDQQTEESRNRLAELVTVINSSGIISLKIEQEENGIESYNCIPLYSDNTDFLIEDSILADLIPVEKCNMLKEALG